MADYRMPEPLRCPKTGQTWNMRVSDEKRLELILCEGCGEMHTLKELLETGRPKLEIAQTH
jgi:hypothetical protein